MKYWISEEGGGWGVHESMDFVVKICQHVIPSEGRCNDAVYNDLIFLRDYGVQPLALHGLYGRDHVFAWHCHNAVAHTDWWGVCDRQGCGRVACPSQDDVTGGHPDVAATSSGDVSEERIIAVGRMGHKHHIRVGSLSRSISRQHTVSHSNIWDDFHLSWFQTQGLGSCKASFQLVCRWFRWCGCERWGAVQLVEVRSCRTLSHSLNLGSRLPSTIIRVKILGVRHLVALEFHRMYVKLVRNMLLLNTSRFLSITVDLQVSRIRYSNASSHGFSWKSVCKGIS